MIAAFFDIDGTIYRNALLIEHFKKLIKYELFDDIQYRLKVAEAYNLWDTRKGNYDDYLLDLTKLYVVDDFCGSVYEIDEKTQTFSGKIIKPMWDSVHKQEAIENFIKKYNIDLAKSYAYGDTNGDFSMLSLVGNPRAINPSKELITKIKNDKNLSSKTQIIIERKDVIYKLNSNVELIEF